MFPQQTSLSLILVSIRSYVSGTTILYFKSLTVGLLASVSVMYPCILFDINRFTMLSPIKPGLKDL